MIYLFIFKMNNKRRRNYWSNECCYLKKLHSLSSLPMSNFQFPTLDVVKPLPAWLKSPLFLTFTLPGSEPITSLTLLDPPRTICSERPNDKGSANVSYSGVGCTWHLKGMQQYLRTPQAASPVPTPSEGVTPGCRPPNSPHPSRVTWGAGSPAPLRGASPRSLCRGTYLAGHAGQLPSNPNCCI